MEGYYYTFKMGSQLVYSYLVTIANSVIGTALGLLIMSMYAYVICQKRFWLERGLTWYLFFTMLFGGGLVPSYILNVRYYHLKDTFWILLISGLLNAYWVIILRTFIKTSIPEALFDSARIDGAGEWTCFRYITVPMLSPVIFYNVVMGIINSLQVFTQVYVIGTNALMPGGSTGSGGGPENSLLSIVQLLYIKGFRDYKMGYASAIAWVLLVIILFFTMLVFKSSALWTYYEEERK